MPVQVVMAEIHTLPGVSLADAQWPMANAEVVKICEDILKLANDEKIRAIAYAFVDNAARTAQGWSTGEQGHRLMASVSYLQHRYAASEVVDSDPTDMPSAREPV